MKKKYLQQKVNEAKEVLDKNIRIHYTIPDLSRKVGINENDLKKGFKLFLKTSIYQYQKNNRLQKALELLETTEKTETDIAWSVGYKHRSNFITAFTKRFGHNPGYFRKS